MTKTQANKIAIRQYKKGVAVIMRRWPSPVRAGRYDYTVTRPYQALPQVESLP